MCTKEATSQHQKTSLDTTINVNSPKINRLIRAIKDGKLIPFIGAGMSITSGKPGWQEFLIDMVNYASNNNLLEEKEKELARDYINKNKFELVAGLLYAKSKSEFEIKVRDTFYHIDKNMIAGAVTNLPKLPQCSRFITTNFDRILEELTNFKPLYVSFQDDIIEARTGNNYILKLHGDIERPATWVLTQTQYDEHYENTDFRALVSDIFRNNIVLFLGCSLMDDRITTIIAAVNKKQAYAIIAEPQDKREIDDIKNRLSTLGITPIWLKNIHGEPIEKVYENQLEPLIGYIIEQSKQLAKGGSELTTKSTDRDATSKKDTQPENPAGRQLPHNSRETQRYRESSSQVRQKYFYMDNFLYRVSVKEDFHANINKITDQIIKDIKPSCIRLFFNIRRMQSQVVAVEYNPWKLAPSFQISSEKGLVGYVLKFDTSAYYPAPENSFWADKYIKTDERIVAELVVPIQMGTQAIGALLIDWTNDHLPDWETWKSRGPKEIIDRILPQAKKIEYELVNRYRDEGALMAAWKEKLLFCITQTESKRGYIALWTFGGNLGYIFAGKETEKFLELYPTEGACGTVLRTGKALIIDDLSNNPDAVVSDPDMLSELIVPIIKDKVVIGIINVESSTGKYSNSDEQLLNVLAQEIAEKYDIPLEKVITSSATIFLGIDDISEDEILRQLEEYTSLMLKLRYERDDVSAKTRPLNDIEENNKRHIYDNRQIPLRMCGKSFTVLELQYPENYPLGQETEGQIQMYAQLAANTIYRRKRFERHKSLVDLLSDLSNINEKRIDIISHLKYIIIKLNNLLESSHATLFWMSPKDEKLQIPGISSVDKLYVCDASIEGYRADQPDQGITGYVFKTKKSIRVSNLQNERSLRELDSELKWGKLISETQFDTKFIERARSYMACPIINKNTNKCIGIIRAYLEGKNPKPSFTETDEHILEAVAFAIKPLLEQIIERKLRPIVELVPLKPGMTTENEIISSHLPPVSIDRTRLPPQLIGYTYTAEEARKARDTDRLLSLRLETSLECNLSCLYCCNASGRAGPNGLELSKQFEILHQAKELGAKSIVFIGGGEFLYHNNSEELLKYTHTLGMIPVIFTNGIEVNPSTARFLYEMNSTVIVKLDSLIPAIQDKLSGKIGYTEQAMQALDNLMDAGYNTESNPKELRLGASCVVTKINYDDVPNVWKFCREKGLFPNIEWLVPNGRAKGNNELSITRDQISILRNKLLKFDQRYGYKWIPYTPRIGSGCLQFMYSLYITYDGFIRPCASFHYQPLNVREVTLKKAMHDDSYLYKTARHIDQHLNGKCRRCEYKHNCCGCRGLTFTTLIAEKDDVMRAFCGDDPSCDHNP